MRFVVEVTGAEGSPTEVAAELESACAALIDTVGAAQVTVEHVEDRAAIAGRSPQADEPADEDDDEDEYEATYRVVRFYRDDRPREIQRTGLTLEEAQSHCNDGNTHGDSWFDGYEEE